VSHPKGDNEEDLAIQDDGDASDLHAQPQTPPRPFPLEPLQTPEKSSDTSNVTVEEGKKDHATSPSEFNREGSIDSVSFLRDVLEEIRSSLDRRFEALEQRFEAHIGQADARITVLENEMRIMTARMRSHVVDGVAAAAAQPVAASTSGTVLHMHKTLPHLSVSPSPPQEASSLDTSSTLASGMKLRFEAFKPVPMPQLPVEPYLPQEEKDLIDKLTSQFRDTQRLLSEAQEQICPRTDSSVPSKNHQGMTSSLVQTENLEPSLATAYDYSHSGDSLGNVSAELATTGTASSIMQQRVTLVEPCDAQRWSQYNVLGASARCRAVGSSTWGDAR
jgi:hypothetical protein